MTRPFWETKSLSEMDAAEWESLCDGCGRCCLLKLEDEENGDVYFTDVACQLLDHNDCRCSHYPVRRRYVPDCIVLTPELVARTNWLPSTCAYRLVYEGRPLYPWHPLVSGDADAVHKAGISVRGCVVSESEVKERDMEEHVIHWIEY